MTMTMWRIVGLALLLVFLLAFDPAQPAELRLALLGLALIGAWLAIANAMALSLTVALLAGLNSHPGGGDPISAWLYPAMAIAAGVVFATIMIRRFIQHMHETHETRWARRRAGRSADCSPGHATERSEDQDER